MDKNRLRELTMEFMRYLLVGGSAFIVDFGVLYITKTFIFESLGLTGIYIATALGFVAGLIYNYILSLLFVFKKAREKTQGRTVRAFLVFSMIGVVGLGITELGMYVGVSLLSIHYLIVKIIMAALVLLWNYIGRKVLIFS